MLVHSCIQFVSHCYSIFNLNFSLVATKDDIAAMNSDGARLINAASENDMDTLKQLLAEKVDVNAQDWDNLTALIAASSKGYNNIVKTLIQHGADLNLRDKDNVTAVM